jgi:hypothetical protein
MLRIPRGLIQLAQPQTPAVGGSIFAIQGKADPVRADQVEKITIALMKSILPTAGNGEKWHMGRDRYVVIRRGVYIRRIHS